MSVGALYLHIPFCHAKCAYCDFDSRGLCGRALDEAAATYLAQLERRIDAFGECGALADLRTVYIGGGTPTVLGERLPALVRRVRSWCEPVEFTCEANPESLSEDLARELTEAGVTRISLGVQSLDYGELARIGRLHDAACALAVIARVKRLGMSVSCDLMCGLPGQTGESWRKTLEGALAAGPDHISVYPLTVEEGTPLARQVAQDPSLEPDEDFQAACMEAARDALTAAGYQRYEVASYARPGHACRHNIAYWTGVGYLGLGRSAAGMLTGTEYLELANLFPSQGDACNLACIAPDDRIRIVQRNDGATRFDVERLRAREAVAEDLMLGMRMSAGVSPELLERARTLFGPDHVDRAITTACREGLAAWRDGRLVPTERGWLMGNELYGLMWGLASRV